jgi:hypothetical protein
MQSFTDHNPDVQHGMHGMIDLLSRYSEGRIEPKQLVQADDDQMFWLHEGPGLRNLRELKVALDNISEDQFAYHVADGKNDFASWVQHVLKDEDCAEELWKCKTVLSTRRVLIKYLKQYA